MNHALTLLTTVVLSLAGVAAAQQASPEAANTQRHQLATRHAVTNPLVVHLLSPVSHCFR